MAAAGELLQGMPRINFRKMKPSSFGEGLFRKANHIFQRKGETEQGLSLLFACIPNCGPNTHR